MAISANYPMPVLVNGYLCNSCTQVAEAQKDIDPADPQAGPWGIDAKSSSIPKDRPAFTLGGLLAERSTPTGATTGKQTTVSSSYAPANPATAPAPGSSGLLDTSV